MDTCQSPKYPSLIHCVKTVRVRRFSGPYFPPFVLNTERYSVSLHIQSECGKIRTRKTTNTDNFIQWSQLIFTIKKVFLEAAKQAPLTPFNKKVLMNANKHAVDQSVCWTLFLNLSAYEFWAKLWNAVKSSLSTFMGGYETLYNSPHIPMRLHENWKKQWGQNNVIDLVLLGSLKPSYHTR